MDIRQLRAGNLVTTNGKPAGTENGSIYKILNVANSGVFEGEFCVQMECYESAFSYWGWNIDLEPIVITDELLVKLGFADRDTFFEIKLSNYKIDIFNNKLYPHDSALCIYDVSNNGKCKLSADIKYLHTLQNLILDITGLDLNVDK